MTHGPSHGQAGPSHGPPHPGDRTSAEPGGFDEFDHPEFAPLGEPDAVNTEAVNDDPGPMPGGSAPSGSAPGSPVAPDGTGAEGDSTEPLTIADVLGEPAAYAALASERLEDLRRLQAEYVNYKKRVDRDRDVAREQGISHVLESMMPVLDEIHFAREHGDLSDGPSGTIVDKLEAVLARLGIERFGAFGDEFDPNHHEALMRLESDLPEGATTTTVVQVLQPGYRLGDRVVRAARVAVADPS